MRWHETEAMVSGPLKELLNYTTGITFEGFAAAESEPLSPLLSKTNSFPTSANAFTQENIFHTTHFSRPGTVGVPADVFLCNLR